MLQKCKKLAFYYNITKKQYQLKIPQNTPFACSKATAPKQRLNGVIYVKITNSTITVDINIKNSGHIRDLKIQNY